MSHIEQVGGDGCVSRGSTEVPVLPENAPFTAEQRLWLNGFLAGYFSRQTFSSAAPSNPAPASVAVPIRIVFGTQTGTAQQLAKRIAKEAAARGGKPLLTDAADFAKVNWAEEHNLLVVTSTYGDGDMPDNAQGWWEWLSTTEASKALSHLRYAVLGLGDRNYSDFCGAGRRIDLRLAELGATRLCPRADCDVEYEATARAWMDSAFAVLLTPAMISSRAVASVPPNVVTDAHCNSHDRTRSSKANPFPARLLRNVRLSKPGSAKEVRHFEIGLEGSDLSYEPGDALGVVPMNCPDLTNEILSLMEESPEHVVEVSGSSLSLREALSRHFDLTKPSRELIAFVAQQRPGCEVGALLRPEGAEALREWLRGRGVIDLVSLLSVRLSAASLLPLLKKLAPRLYSIASSPKAHPGEVHLTVSTVRYESHGRCRKGVASTFLAERVGEREVVRVFVQPSHGFKLPADGNTPLIMVGPGTGIAPFRAFLEERQACGAGGRNWLFFGDQRRDTDFLYEEQLSAWLHSGHLARLDLAFSRDQTQKIYVQHRMLQHARELWAWLQDGSHFYVCGDAARMAKDVETALLEIAQSAGGKSAEEAESWLAKLKTEKRYQRDVY